MPLWLIGQSEMLAPVLPGLPVVEAAPLAFMSWQLWLAALGIALALRGRAALRPR